MSIVNKTFTRRQVLAGLGAAAVASAASPFASSVTASAATKKGATSATTLRVGHWYGHGLDPFVPLMKQLTGFQTIMEPVPYNSYEQKLLTQIASGTAPDIFNVDANWAGDIFASGVVQPMDDYLNSAHVDMSKFAFSQTLENGYNGQIMGLSISDAFNEIVYINMELAEKAGMLKDAPVWGSPAFDTWKWPQFLTWLEQGNKVTSSGKVEQYAFEILSVMRIFQVMLASLGGQIYSNEWSREVGPTQKCVLDSEVAFEAANEALNVVTKLKLAPSPTVDTTFPGGSFLSGRAVTSTFDSATSIFPIATTFPQALMALPYLDKKPQFVAPNTLCVNKFSPNREAALKWVTDFATNRRANALFFQQIGSSGYDPKQIIEALPNGYTKTVTSVGIARIKGQSTVPGDTTNVVLYPNFAPLRMGAFTSTTVTNALTSIAVGSSSVKAALTSAAQALNARLQ